MSIMNVRAELEEAMHDFVYACHYMKQSTKRWVSINMRMIIVEANHQCHD